MAAEPGASAAAVGVASAWAVTIAEDTIAALATGVVHIGSPAPLHRTYHQLLHHSTPHHHSRVPHRNTRPDPERPVESYHESSRMDSEVVFELLDRSGSASVEIESKRE